MKKNKIVLTLVAPVDPESIPAQERYAGRGTDRGLHIAPSFPDVPSPLSDREAKDD